MAGAGLLGRHQELEQLGYKHQDIGAIVAAAALAHDIGNPPFGHSGEKAMGAFFDSGIGETFMSTLSRKQKQDLLLYEGNANGYHILNRDAPGTPGGLRLSYATLGAFVKYPKESLPQKPSTHISDKKYGIFQADVEHFEAVATHLGMKNGERCHRHPLAYLVEAADDICYSIIDFEDGINLGWISEDHALEQLINLVRDSIKTSTYSELGTTAARLSYLRSLAINTLIKDCVEIFMDSESLLLNGDLEKSLVDYSRFKPQLDDILAITIEKVYRHEEVIHKEIGGYKILQTILENLLTARINLSENQTSAFDKLILRACPEVNSVIDDRYTLILETCGFVASLTDSRASKLYDILSGQMSF
jgi:dGTPase